MQAILKFIKFLSIILLGLLLLVNVINIVQTAILKQEMPLLFGYGRAVVITGSMEPAIKPCDIVIIHEQENYQVGDIVIYKAHSYITHRIVAKTDDGYITQGDANNVDDGEILKSQVVGKVIRIIPQVGKVIDFFKTPLGMLILIGGLFLLIKLPYYLTKFRNGGE